MDFLGVRAVYLAGPSDLLSVGWHVHSPGGLCWYLDAPLELENAVVISLLMDKLNLPHLPYERGSEPPESEVVMTTDFL